MVSHDPPGASKWNPIDPRMFSLISANWAGEPLVSYETVLKSIHTTRSQAGSRCRRVWTPETPQRRKSGRKTRRVCGCGRAACCPNGTTRSGRTIAPTNRQLISGRPLRGYPVNFSYRLRTCADGSGLGGGRFPINRSDTDSAVAISP